MKFCIATNQTIRKEVNKKKETHSANNLTKKKKKKKWVICLQPNY